MKIHIKKGDMVEVLSGKDKGKRGKVSKVFLSNGKALVDGVNVVKRHTKPRPPKVPQGGILEKTLPLYVSRLMLVCPQCNKRTRVSKQVLEDGSRVKVCQQCKKEIR